MSLFRPAEHLTRVDTMKATYVGTVIYNTDPNKAGRVKCTIPNLFVGAHTELPWVYPANSAMGGGKADNSSFNVPEIGALLNIRFPNGDVLNPVYEGSPQTAGTTNEAFDDDYPNSYGQVDSTGFSWKMNKTTKLLTIHHPGGVDITIDANGKLTIKTTTDSIRIEAADKIEVVAPEIDLTASTKVVVTSPEIDLTASTKVNVVAPAVNLTASTKVEIEGSSEVSVSAPSIKLN